MVKQRLPSFAFKECKFQEHCHLTAIVDKIKAVLYELLCIFIWRVGHHIAMHVLCIGQEVDTSLTISMIIQVLSYHLMTMFLENVSNMASTTAWFVYGMRELLHLKKHFYGIGGG